MSALLFVHAAAEPAAPEIAPDAVPIYMPVDMSADEIREFVELLFAAATGTTVENEEAQRADMTEEALAARNAANAEYRAKTLPWLIAVLQPEPLTALEQSPDASETAILPEQNETASEQNPDASDTTLLADDIPAYTAADGYAAFAQTETGEAYLARMAEMNAADMEKCLLLTREICGKWMSEVDHEALSQMNGDYVCWIYAPNSQIDYPVVQGEDNSHYLKLMFNGAHNSAGTLFIDYRNLPDFQDPNTLIYGHHMRNDSMFGALTDYAEQAYFEGHPFMLVTTRDEIFLLEIFAGYTTSKKDHCYDIAISDEDDMRIFVEEAMTKSDFESGAQIGTTDRLVTLSTCAYAFENARYIAIGRIVPVWDAACVEEPNADAQEINND